MAVDDPVDDYLVEMKLWKCTVAWQEYEKLNAKCDRLANRLVDAKAERAKALLQFDEAQKARAEAELVARRQREAEEASATVGAITH